MIDNILIILFMVTGLTTTISLCLIMYLDYEQTKAFKDREEDLKQ
jgi:hypothetical protein